MQFTIQTIFAILAASFAMAKPTGEITTINVQVKDGLKGLTRRNYNNGYESDNYVYGGRHHHRGHRHGGHWGHRHGDYEGRRHGVYRRDRGHANYGPRRHFDRN